MPEGPELYKAAQYLNKIASTHTFTKVRLLYDPIPKRPAIPWHKTSFNITGQSRGKEIRISLSDTSSAAKCNILLTFAMTGRFKFTRTNEEEKYSMLMFDTNNGHTFSFVDLRHFGRWSITDGWSPLKNRGPCIISEYWEFRKHVLGSMDNPVFGKPICEVMLDQRYFSCIGNYLRAEILYRFQVDPFSSARKYLANLVDDSPTEVSDMKMELEGEVETVKLCNVKCGAEEKLTVIKQEIKEEKLDKTATTEYLGNADTLADCIQKSELTVKQEIQSVKGVTAGTKIKAEIVEASNFDGKLEIAVTENTKSNAKILKNEPNPVTENKENINVEPSEVKFAKEESDLDILELSHKVCWEVINLAGSGKPYDPDGIYGDNDVFEDWLQCYGKLSSSIDSRQRTMWHRPGYWKGKVARSTVESLSRDHPQGTVSRDHPQEHSTRRKRGRSETSNKSKTSNKSETSNKSKKKESEETSQYFEAPKTAGKRRKVAGNTENRKLKGEAMEVKVETATKVSPYFTQSGRKSKPTQ